jgi:glycosyltransferase involved in cell wall biosynthesis
MENLRVLVAHNAYQMRGGEDAVVEAEVALLRSYGHPVVEYRRHNDELKDMRSLDAAIDTLWSRKTGNDLDKLVAEQRPDVIHAHNTFPLISPSLYWAAHRHGIPVVQTLHNFRLLCPQAMFLREGKVCEDCLGKLPWRAVQHACYRESRTQSAALGGMLVMHRMLGTWGQKVTRYIALNEFCRGKFIEGGLPADRISIKPNFVDFAPPAQVERTGFLYVGRLAPEKGVSVLAAAVPKAPGIRLAVAGNGPDAHVFAGIEGASHLGAVALPEVRRLMCSSLALVMPSIWYENFPRTLVEAYGCGLPVIASRIGALAELVDEGVTGLLFKAGDSDDLAGKLRWAQSHQTEMAAMGRRARARFEAEFTPQNNYQQLMDIYRVARMDSTQSGQW